MQRLVTIVTSAYSSYSSCRQYREDLAAAQAAAAETGLVIELDKVRPYANHPGFARANTRLVTEAVRGVLRDGVDARGGAPAVRHALDPHGHGRDVRAR